jgi:hypothetical protein
MDILVEDNPSQEQKSVHHPIMNAMDFPGVESKNLLFLDKPGQ